MDTFAYHPPNTHSPGRYGHSPSADPAANPSPSFAPRPSSSSGAHASGGFTATLPPLQEHAATDSIGGSASGAQGGTRPTLVEFEQLAGEDALGGLGGDSGDGAYAQSAFGAGASGVGFRDPFARPGSTAGGGQGAPQATSGMFAAGAVGMNGAQSHSPSHAYFNPQTINPSVNSRNTRPMTAPSGHGYMGAHSYSAAPSNFYTPAHPGTIAAFGSFHGAPPHTAVPHSAFQYQVDSNPHAIEYDSFRARGFSLPDVNGNTMGIGVDPLVQVGEGTSPPSSTPFFYTPPAVQSAARPMTTSGMFYPAVLDPHASAVMPAPLVTAPGTVFAPAPGPPFAPYSSDTSRPGSSSNPPATGRRRSSGGTTATASGGKQYNFVQQGGQVTKRPRRRYDEIERMYNCDYPGCTKAYGTLNHLNSHKTMQKHGPKSTPAQFKEIRKAWRERKKAEAAAAARAQAAAPPQSRGQPSAPSNGAAPPLVPIPGSTQTADRPRPSTSAGEYHLAMPVPYVSAGDAPSGPPYDGGVSQGAATLPVGRAQPVAPLDAHLGMYTGSVGGPFDPFGSSSANRPVTAPSYYVAPSFGSIPPHHPLAIPPTTASHTHQPSPLGSGATARSTNRGSSNVGATAAAPADRRFSLPVSSLGSSAPAFHLPPPAPAALPPPPPSLGGASPEMKMPQPVPPAASFALLASAGGPSAGGGAAEEVSAQ